MLRDKPDVQGKGGAVDGRGREGSGTAWRGGGGLGLTDARDKGLRPEQGAEWGGRDKGTVNRWWGRKGGVPRASKPPPWSMVRLAT